MLHRFRRPDGSLELDGIFTSNESNTLALLRVLQSSGWAGKVKFIGFDASDTLVKGLSDGHIDALVVQDPVKMGYLGVKTMVDHLQGRPVEKRIDTGAQLVTRDRDVTIPPSRSCCSPISSSMVEAVTPPSRGFGEAGAQFEMRGVRKAFGGTVALDGVDLAVRGGEVCALVGQNGAGKSTLMSILAGAIAPDAGTMTLNGAPYAPRDPRDARQAGVAMIYQELSLAPHLSVMDNIALGVEPARQGALGRARHRSPRCGPPHGARGARAARPLGHSRRRAGRRAVAGGAAARRNRARAGIRLPRARARRADEQPRARRRAEAVRADRPAQAAGPRHRVHLALHRGSDAGLRPLRRAARWPQRRRRCDRRDAAAIRLSA